MGVDVKLVRELEHRATALLTGPLLERLEHLDNGPRRLDIIGVRGGEALLMLGEAKRDDGEARDAGMGLDVLESCEQFIPVIDPGAKHDLRMDLDTGLEEALEHLDAARRVAPDELASALRRDGVKRHVHGREHLVDGVFDLGVLHIRKGHEIALQKAQAIIVVPNGERGSALLGEHVHEAEDAGVHAGAYPVEHDAVKIDAPFLARETLDHSRRDRVVTRVEYLDLGLDVLGLPQPHDHIGERLAIHREHAHAGLESYVICRRIGGHRQNGGAV